jgi:hypothetical protein
MPPRPPPRPAPTPGRAGPALTPIAHSAAWQTAHQLHARALTPADGSPEAFDAAAASYWTAGEVEHTFTAANLALLRMAQAEEHHLAQMHATAAMRQDLAELAARLDRVNGVLTAIGKATVRGQRLMEGLGGEALEQLGRLADAWDDKPAGEDDATVDGDARPASAGLRGEKIVGDDQAPPRAGVGRADRYPREPAPDNGPEDDDGGDDEELVDVDEQGNPLQEGQ